MQECFLWNSIHINYDNFEHIQKLRNITYILWNAVKNLSFQTEPNINNNNEKGIENQTLIIALILTLIIFWKNACIHYELNKCLRK